jgi:hypothetical protein
MAESLNTCTAIQQRGVVRFLWAKNMDAAKDIHKEMLPICLYTHIFGTIWRRWSGKINKKNWDSSECGVPQVCQPWYMHPKMCRCGQESFD